MDSSLGDRMKAYEMAEAGRKLMPLLPVVARLDGRCFSKLTATLNKPYDKRLANLMIATTKFLTQETNANCGYTQSDEITLGWSGLVLEMFFGGRIQKITSTLSAMASVFFNKKLPEYFGGDAGWMSVNSIPTFDCRVWNLPNIEEATNAFLWRELDATKNAINGAASCYYRHGDLMNKSCAEKQEMLFKKGVNFNDFPAYFKRGTYIQKKEVLRKFSAKELDVLPKNHEARKNSDLLVKRSEFVQLYPPPLTKVINRSDVIFFGKEPIVESEDIKEVLS